MRNEENKQGKDVIDFLKYSITYLEDRIRLRDNKASILIVVQGVIFGAFTFAIKEILLNPAISSNKLPGYKELVYIVLGVAFFLSLVTIALLIQAIRPTNRYFGLNIPVNRLEKKHYVMWFHDKFPGTPEDYKKEIEALNESEIKQNYQATHFVHLQLVKRKTQSYKWAVLIMKLSILWIGTGISTLLLAVTLPVCYVILIWIIVMLAIPVLGVTIRAKN